ncbi:MAG: iron chaperone, partial [Candidatus Nanopelagicales bacterium]
FKKAEVVIAWNQPMLKQDSRYLFGASAQKAHILIAPFNADIIDELRPRLEGYEVNKKTIRVPVDWKVDKKLLTDMVSAQFE